MKSLITLTVLAAVALSSSSIVKSPTGSGDNFELLILHNNDMHARFEQTSQVSNVCTTADREAGKCYGGFPRVAHVVKQARAAAASGQGPPVLYLNAGDTYTGTAWFTIYKWKIAAEFVNALQPDAVSLGNHELDDNVEGLIPFLKNLSMPVLAANLILDKEPEWQKETHIQPSVVLSKNGTKIGIIGYLTPDTTFLSPRNNIVYEEEVFAITREVKKLKRQGVTILIALGHSGYITDIRIARDVPDLDLVIGGHSHTLLWNNNSTDEKPEIPQGPYPTIVKQSSGREVLVVQAYAFTKYIGELHLIFDSNGEIIHYDGEPLLLDQKVPRDPELLESVNKYRKEFEEDNNEVVGSSLVFLDGNKCRLRECNMGDFITDTILKYSIEKLGKSDLTVAVIQGGRIRASIDSPEKPFQLTKGDWITVLPFMDGLVAVAANGSVLLQSLEHSVAAWRTIDSSGQFLQYSGLEVTYDLAKPPGSRVVKARAVCSTCGNNFTDIKDNYEYKIIMSEYLANNGDGFTLFQLLNREKLFYTEIDSVLEYLHKYGTVNYSESGRITILNEDKVLGNVPEVKRDKIKNERYLPSNGAIFGQNYIVLLSIFSCYIYFVSAEML